MIPFSPEFNVPKIASSSEFRACALLLLLTGNWKVGQLCVCFRSFREEDDRHLEAVTSN